MGILGTSIIQAGTNAVGGLVNYGLNRLSQKHAFETNVRMWNMQNEYDTPQQQMSRLQQAGLNPSLVYGGNTVGNTSSSAPRMEAPNANIQPVDYQSVLLTHQSIEKMKADTDSVRAQTENTIQQTAINKSMAIIDLAQKEIQKDISSKERDYWYNIKEAELQNLQVIVTGKQIGRAHV